MGVIEAIDIFLIAIFGLISALGRYVLLLREAVAWDGERDLLAFGAALALVIAALARYLALKGKR